MRKNINQLRILILFAIVSVAVFIIMQLPLTLGLDLQGGTRLVFEGKESPKVKVSDDAMSGVVLVIRNRIDALGVAEPLVQRKGRDQIIVELPGVKDPDRAIKLIGDTALLEFIEAEWAPKGAQNLSADKVKEFYGKDARMVTYSPEKTEMSRTVSIILKKTALTGADLKTVSPKLDEYGNPSIYFELNPEGAKVFAELTSRHIEKPIAILLDGKVISAPNVKNPITEGEGVISGDFSANEVKDMIIKLKAGSLPLPIEMIETRIVGPTLGKDSIERSFVAGIVGFSIIMVFMIMYYRLPGFMADIALIIYVLVTVAILSIFRATLTLPGIAGFLLSIGMAVDANIIIFERLKEEMRSGKSIRISIESAFERAFSAILDANVTTLIAASTLIFIGTGTIRGFAVTLSVGILVSMFTAIVLTRMLLNMLVDGKVLTSTETKLVYK
ncbi:MAG: protein translocase subunit SecD [Candidatus Saganbacteria bacterium]|nr:protein translocase subunit SecD [Candidatus Saganbacteria bacterium]